MVPNPSFGWTSTHCEREMETSVNAKYCVTEEFGGCEKCWYSMGKGIYRY